MNSNCIMIIICRAIVWALNCLNYLSLQKSPAQDNSVALQKMQYVLNSSHGLLVILYVPFIMMFLLSVALQKLQYIVNSSHGLLVILCPLYYDALLRQVILVSINWKISEVDVGAQWVKGLATFWLGVVA